MNKQIKVMTIGVYDLLHRGHIIYLNLAKSLGDKLIVGIMSDQFTKKQKKHAPIQNQKDRRFAVQNLKCVDETFIYTKSDYLKYFKNFNADIFYLTYECKNDPRFNPLLNYIEKTNKKMVYVKISKSFKQKYSSSLIKKRIQGIK